VETRLQSSRGSQLFLRHFLILLDDDYEDLELWYPELRLIEAGAEITAPENPVRKMCRLPARLWGNVWRSG
jgi:hypothetical protein